MIRTMSVCQSTEILNRNISLVYKANFLIIVYTCNSCNNVATKIVKVIKTTMSMGLEVNQDITK